jgi:uncharacterized damage-inducible protein DinB
VIETLRTALHFDQSANATVFESLRRRGGEPPKALAAFQHVLEAELIWLHRLRGDAISIPLWGPASLDQCEQWLSESSRELDALAGRLSDEMLASTFSYRTSRGDDLHNNTGEIVLHMLLHSAQYRGEAMGFLNANGASVPDAEFILYLTKSAKG